MSLFAGLLGKLNLLFNYYQYIYICIIMEAFFLTIIFTSELKKKKYYPLRLAASFGISLLVIYLFSLIRSTWDNVYVKRLLYFVMYVGIGGIVFFLVDDSFSYNLFISISILTVRESVDCLNIFLLLCCGSKPNERYNLFSNRWLNYLVYDRMHILLQAGLYLLLRKKILSAKNLQMTKTIDISLFIILLISVVGKAIATSSKNYDSNYYLSIGLILLICLGVFYRILSFLNENRAIQEKAIISQRIETSKKQYESLKTDRETINTLSHDIKHQLVYLQSKVTEDDLSRLKESVKSYDNTWNTGNKVIDTLLYDRQIKCNEKKILISCLCDPTAINQRNQIHLYFLITNILDNAMEACEKVDEKDRCISLVIRKDKEKTIIEESNYFSGQRQIVNNSLATSKKDKKNHGYGIKSIKRIVGLYDGDVQRKTADNRYFLTLSFVQKEIKDN